MKILALFCVAINKITASQTLINHALSNTIHALGGGVRLFDTVLEVRRVDYDG